MDWRTVGMNEGGSNVAVFIHRKAHFAKYLQKLHRAGGRSAFAAERALSIITTLVFEPGVPEPTVASDAGLPSTKPDVDMDYDDLLMQKIDEQTLRRIFHGLCGD